MGTIIEKRTLFGQGIGLCLATCDGRKMDLQKVWFQDVACDEEDVR